MDLKEQSKYPLLEALGLDEGELADNHQYELIINIPKDKIVIVVPKRLLATKHIALLPQNIGQ